MTQYIRANPEIYRMLQSMLTEHERWSVRLFSPAGLAMLFPGLRK